MREVRRADSGPQTTFTRSNNMYCGWPIRHNEKWRRIRPICRIFRRSKCDRAAEHYDTQKGFTGTSHKNEWDSNLGGLGQDVYLDCNAIRDGRDTLE
jgi:hypothetical protein